MKTKRVKPSLTPRADATHCVHSGEDRHGRNAPLTTEIVQTSVFVMRDVEELRRYAAGKSNAYMYTRYSNPTIAAAEQKIASLEGAESCVITSSGTSAVLMAVLAVCKGGDEIVSTLDLYGGTLKLFEEVLPRLGIRTRLVPFGDLGKSDAKIDRYFSKRTRLLWLETPTNPALRCMDIRRMAEIARRHRVLLAVDSTMATPILQKPLALGADLVVHSATKYLGGHSDVTAGAVAGSAKLIGEARTLMLRSGTNLDPGAAYLLLRGLKTLSLRVERACRNASLVAEALRQHPKVVRVMYPGLADHEGHEVAERQMADFGMMVAFDIRRGGKAAERFINALKLWYLAPSFGGVESSVSYPVLTSHVNMSRSRLRQLGVSPAMVRLSVGIEEAEDLITDLNQALAKA